jgi:hypothetical protein
LIRLKTPHSQIKRKEWPLGPSRTVDDLTSVPESRFLLIKPEIDSDDTEK